jgi:hypothetical protein
MQNHPPKYQVRSVRGLCGLRTTFVRSKETVPDPLEHEEEADVRAILLAETSYAKDSIPLENICNVTVVTDLSGVCMLIKQR